MKLISNDWFKARAYLKIQIFIVEGHEIEGMALTVEQCEEVKACGSYAEMLEVAADFGLSCERSRVSDNKELKKDIKTFWAEEAIEGADCEPSVRHKFGLKICAISGLNESLEETAQLEEAEKERIKAEAEEKAKQEAEKPEGTVVDEAFIAKNGDTDLDKIKAEAEEAKKYNLQP